MKAQLALGEVLLVQGARSCWLRLAGGLEVAIPAAVAADLAIAASVAAVSARRAAARALWEVGP